MLSPTESHLVRRLRAVCMLLIAANAALTLLAQPAAFWSDPRTAIRFDALPIHSSTNPMFDFLLGHGWLAYLACVALYAAIVWIGVAALPKRLAIVAELTIILGLCFSGSNRVVVGWSTGVGGSWLWVGAVGSLLAAAVIPSVPPRHHRALNLLLALMALTTAVDAAFTLIGQPASYWRDTATVFEGNPIAKYFLEIGWWAYLGYILVWIAVPWLIALRASRPAGWTIAFAFTLGGLLGGSNWLFYVWRLGLQAPLLYMLAASILMAWFVFAPGAETQSHKASRRSAPGGAGDSAPRRVFNCC